MVDEEEIVAWGPSVPRTLYILALTGDGILGAKEHSWDKSALAETHMLKREQGLAALSWGSRTLWRALKMPQFVVITENGRVGGPESQRDERTFTRANTELCSNPVNSRITGHLIKCLLARTQNSLQIAAILTRKT